MSCLVSSGMSALPVLVANSSGEMLVRQMCCSWRASEPIMIITRISCFGVYAAAGRTVL